MILANVNIGTGPSAGDGDLLRSAFTIINNNFTKLQSNVNSLSNSVSSVAGRTGNVILTTQDIVGITNYATITYVNNQLGNAGSANISALESNVALLQVDVNTLYGNAGVQSSTLATLTSNAAIQAGNLATLTSNAAVQAGELTTLLSNASVQAGEIASLLSNAGSQHEAISSLQSNISTLFANAGAQADSIYTLTSNAAIQAGQIASLQANSGIGNYGNSNVASYLPSYGGNVSVADIIFDDLSVQSTAYTGVQWRTRLDSSLLTKPSWLSYVPGGKNQEGTQYGFGSSGMFFKGNADNDFAYPIQTSLQFHETDVLEVSATIYFSATNNDHGLCIFSADTRPIWRTSIDSTRIAFQYTAGIPVLYGQTTSNTAPGSPVLVTGNFYTIKFSYDPSNTVVVETFSGNTAAGTPIDTRSINEVLPPGDYKLGFDADNDAVGVNSYYTSLTIKTLTNAAFNDIEILNDLSVGGSIIGGNSRINFVANSSGDGYNSSTIRLIPETGYSVGVDQYLIIDPTSPNHIHIRAGGTQDNSGTQLFVGGETSHLRVDSGLNPNVYISANSNVWTFGIDGNLTLPTNGAVSYSPTTSSDWSGTPPTTIGAAIDRLASVVKALNGGTGA